jgi:hypothetical protein
MTTRSALHPHPRVNGMGSSFFRPTLFIVIVLLATSASSYPQADVSDHGWMRSELYFGQTDRNSKPINQQAWLKFVHRSIASSFHDGFTIIRGTGGWTDDKHHFYEEPTRILVVVYPKAKAQVFDEAIRRVSSQYIREFNQESVLRVDSKAEATFYNH